MNNILSSLEPKLIWKYFEEICQVPRPSKKEERISKYLMDFAAELKLEARQDKAGNVLICKPATSGRESLKTVILQSHMDMVCEKNKDVEHNFDTDPIIPYIDGEWVKARGTTLGADDGIGIAAQMAILASNKIEHGPIECLFTVDEETGLTGAEALEPGFMKGQILLNLDSEDEGELFIGCAGGIDTVATLKFKRRVVPINHTAYSIAITGLKGGHSGDEIHKGYGNANKIANRFLWESRKFKFRLSGFDGGNLRNAIPREAFVSFMLPSKNETAFLDMTKKLAKDIKAELSINEPDLKITIEKTSSPSYIINKSAQKDLINALYSCPHGVIAMSASMPGMVETSTNLASVKFKDNSEIIITTSQRSDRDSAKRDIANMVQAVFKMAGCEVVHGDGYPGWAPNPDSDILRASVASYKKLFNTEPVVRSIHAGLECGLFLEKYPFMDMVSFGPTLRSVHSPDEKINIPTVIKFWDLLLDILKNIPKA
ncbi:MAG: aminoacyl-histidine dipeptidase [Bacteroidales bacterium]|jgi:dipeptidase D|nr:aminoacyl-histidine dipeptidase [Bacteroidales bacterium]